MKLAAKYDVEAPAAFVFAQLTDFDGWERAAMRRGADVMRSDTLPTIGPGMTWVAQFHYRNKDRKTTISLDEITPITHLALTGKSAPVDGTLALEVQDLGAKRTRVEVRLEVKPNTLAARIYVQSLRLARARVERGFSQRVAQMAVEIENRFRGAERR